MSYTCTLQEDRRHRHVNVILICRACALKDSVQHIEVVLRMRMIVINFLLISFRLVLLLSKSAFCRFRDSNIAFCITTKYYKILNPSTWDQFSNRLGTRISTSHLVTSFLKADCFVIPKQSFPPATYILKMMKPWSSVSGSLLFLYGLYDHAGVFFISNWSRGESALNWHLWKSFKNYHLVYLQYIATAVNSANHLAGIIHNYLKSVFTAICSLNKRNWDD